MKEQIPEYQEGIQYSEDIRNAVLFGYMYRKEAERQGDNRGHFRLGDVPDILLWLASVILSGITWDYIKSAAKSVYQRLNKEGSPLKTMEESVLSDEKLLKEFYQDVKEFNEQRMAITETQFQYIREEIEADVIGKELSRIYCHEMREPTIQEITAAIGKAKQKTDDLLGKQSASI